MILNRPSIMLRIEGLAVFVAAAYIYATSGWSLIIFILLFLAVDLSMLGYLISTKVGAMSYNLFHLYVIPIGLLAVGYLLVLELVTQIGVIWLAHIGIDRAIGYGFKTADGLKITHIQQLMELEK